MRFPLIRLALLPLVLLSLRACNTNDFPPVAYPPTVKDEAKGPSHNTRAIPQMGPRQVISCSVEELSGLCMNRDSTAFWAVSDEGVLCGVSFTGKVTSKLPLEMDSEGVTLNPKNGDLYIAVEGDQMVCRIAAPDYKKIDTLFYVKEAKDGHFGNNGLEGITFYKDSLLMVGSQEDALLWICKLDGTVVKRVCLREESSLIEEVAGLCYDPVKDWLWVVDSDAGNIFIFSVKNFDLIASYDVGFIDNAESICVDRSHGYVWVGDDEEPSKIYKFSFNF